MGSDKNVEIAQKAIRKLMEEEEINAKISSSYKNFVAIDEEDDNEKAGGRRRHQRQLLSKLLSQLESLQQDNNDTEESKQEEAKVEDALSSEIDEKNTTPDEVGSCSSEEIIKELKNVQRQNLITHCLLTAMIVITLAWQLSEVSLILKIRDGLSNPFKSVGGIIRGFLKWAPEVPDVIKQAPERQKQVIETTPLPGLKIPELSHLGLPGFDMSDDED